MQVEVVTQVVGDTGEKFAGVSIMEETRSVQVLRPASAVARVAERKQNFALFGKAKLFSEANNNNNLKGITEASKEEVVIETPLFESDWHAVLAKKKQQESM